jgi:hypothetical protein
LNSASNLASGSIYFTIDYCDEELLYPHVQAYVYLGADLLGSGTKQGKHFFQTTDSYREAGNWAAMSNEERSRLGPEVVISCDDEDIGLISDVDELIDELRKFQRRGGCDAGS